MLPDYPNLKNEINQFLYDYFGKIVESRMPFVSQLPKTKIFEGTGSMIRRSNGEEDPTDMDSSMVELEVKFDEIPNLTFDDILRRVEKMANEMAESIEKKLFKSLSRQLDKHNRTFDNKGEKLSGRTILKTYENMFIPFDKDGKPELPSIVTSPKAVQKFKDAFLEIQNDEKLKKEYEELIHKKKDEWNAEQASRKLVG
jgi:hypothetical protein